jgi:hypothetical protein
MAIQRIQFRRGTTAQWASENPILAIGELGLELDTAKIKIGDGSTAWASLDYKLETAYEIAVRNGFSGTEAEWLTSLVGPQGDPGATGLNWQGEWLNTTDYTNNDAVYYNGASWFASGDPTVGEEPTVSATHWFPLALQGATGATGPQGPQGDPGEDMVHPFIFGV